jgi:hypothetical protein
VLVLWWLFRCCCCLLSRLMCHCWTHLYTPSSISVATARVRLSLFLDGCSGILLYVVERIVRLQVPPPPSPSASAKQHCLLLQRTCSRSSAIDSASSLHPALKTMILYPPTPDSDSSFGHRRHPPSTASSTSSGLCMTRPLRSSATMRLRHLCCSSPATYPPTAFQDLVVGFLL